MSTKKIDYTNQMQVMGHPAGLFVLFFTEMWERFSYYGMRALLVLFLVSSAGIGGWEWSNAEAIGLYGTYTGLVYLTPMFGGLIADKLTGYKLAILIGALLMTLGHASMAFETEPMFYLGLGLLIIGNGLFKPNISSIVGGLYKGNEEKKDAGYTLFYMGINAGAFLGIMLCGYIGEKVGWSYGFGLAGVFMAIGMLQFFFAQNIFGDIGEKPEKVSESLKDVFKAFKEDNNTDAPVYGFNEDEVSKEISNEIEAISVEDKKSFINELKLNTKKKIEKDRLIVIGILAFFTIFFWMAFEQAGGSMTIFAKDFTDRVLTGSAANWFTIINTIITVVPLALITWVLILLNKATIKKYAISGILLTFSFIIIWGIVGWMIKKDFNTKAYLIEYSQERELVLNDTIKGGDKITEAYLAEYINNSKDLSNSLEVSYFLASKKSDSILPIEFKYRKVVIDTATIRTDVPLAVNSDLFLLDVDNQGELRYLDNKTAEKVEQKIEGRVYEIKENEVEVPASWFGILNSLFIIMFAPVFSKIWESKYNPTAPVKFGIGLILLGLGFGVLAFGSIGIGSGVTSVSMIWLILAYLLHTLGELTLSPVGLSYVSKLSPPKLLGLMFGIWFISSAIANKVAGMLGGMIDYIQDEYSLAMFFLIFTFVPVVAGLIVIGMGKFLLKKMHGIR